MRESNRRALVMAIAVASGLVLVSACNSQPAPAPPASEVSSPPAEPYTFQALARS